MWDSSVLRAVYALSSIAYRAHYYLTRKLSALGFGNLFCNHSWEGDENTTGCTLLSAGKTRWDANWSRYPHVTADGASGSRAVQVSWLPCVDLRQESLLRRGGWNQVIKMSPPEFRIHIAFCLAAHFCGAEGDTWLHLTSMSVRIFAYFSERFLCLSNMECHLLTVNSSLLFHTYLQS